MIRLSYRIGSGYKASPFVETSIANAEVLPPTPLGQVPIHFYKFTFINDADCSLLINNDPIPKFIRAGQWLNVSETDIPISSIKVVESNVPYNWFGAY